MINNISLPTSVKFTGTENVKSNPQGITINQSGSDTVSFTSGKAGNVSLLDEIVNWSTNQQGKILLKSEKVEKFNKFREKHEYFILQFPSIDLSSKQLYEINLSYVNLYKANLKNTNLEHARLRWTVLNGACLTDTNLVGADLTWACLTDTNLVGAILDGAQFTASELDVITEESKTYIDKNYIRKDIGNGMVELQPK